MAGLTLTGTGLSILPYLNAQPIGPVSTDGYVLQNPAPATLGAQQFSPRLHWQGQGFATTPGQSQTIDWIAELQPVQGAVNPSGNLVISAQVNGAGYSALATFGSSGTNLTVTSQHVGDVPFNIKGFSGQTGNYFTISSNSGAGDILTVEPNGVMLTSNTIQAGGTLFSQGGTGASLGADGFGNPLVGFANRTFIISLASGNLQFGGDAALPAAQTFQMASVSAGTSNTAGVNWTLNGSRGTGTGLGGDIVFQTAPAGASGSSQNAFAEAFRISNLGTVKFSNSASFSANGTVATTLGSVGPTGSHATVQTWLTFVDSGGITRYVPCF